MYMYVFGYSGSGESWGDKGAYFKLFCQQGW